MGSSKETNSFVTYIALLSLLVNPMQLGWVYKKHTDPKHLISSVYTGCKCLIEIHCHQVMSE